MPRFIPSCIFLTMLYGTVRAQSPIPAFPPKDVTEAMDRDQMLYQPGIASFNPTALQPDNGAGLSSFLMGLVNKVNWCRPSDWGAIGAWNRGIGLTGYSRYGKANLVIMGYEPGFQLDFPAIGQPGHQDEPAPPGAGP